MERTCKSCHAKIAEGEGETHTYDVVFTVDPDAAFEEPELRTFRDTLCGKSACSLLNDEERTWLDHTQVCSSQDDMRDEPCTYCETLQRNLATLRRAVAALGSSDPDIRRAYTSEPAQ
jgi:hypothetical protein